MDTDSLATGRTAAVRTMAQLLGEKRYPVIPDMQRDYCWGLEKASSPIEMQRCSVFVGGLIRMFKAISDGGRQMPVGLLYCYELPSGGGINIIDGQQRLTTLYLLMGMLYRRIPDTEIGRRYRNLLVSETADGDFRPKLLYQSKDEAMYFLTDLVSKFFLSRHGRLSQIEQSKWYFKSYDADTNARSFLGAIRSIDATIEKELSANPDFDFVEFARFIADEVVFWYFDLKERAIAEKAFITINTTSHPLTLAQNLRALAIGFAGPEREMATAQEWNDMEDWFWRRSAMSIDDFLQLAIKCGVADDRETTSPQDFVIEVLPQLFDAFSRCVESGVDMTNEFVAVPMMRYAVRFSGRASGDDIDRIGHLLANYTRYQKTGAADRQQAMDLVMRMPRPELGSALDMRNMPTKIINSEERSKILLLQEHRWDSRLQSLLRRAEEHPMLRGRVEKVIAWSTERVENEWGHGRRFSLSAFQYYVDRIYEIWGVDIDRRDDLDPVRRALLSMRHRLYPIVRRGDMVLSLCWKDYDWQRLMVTAPGLIRQLIDHSKNFGMEELASRFTDRNYPYYFIIKDAGVLEGCRKRQLMRPCDPFVGIYYLEANCTHWWVDQRPLRIFAECWRSARPHGKTALHIDHCELNAAIGIVFAPSQHYRFRVELFRRPDSAKGKVDLKYVADNLRRPMRYERSAQRFSVQCVDSASAIKCAEEIMMAFICAQ